MMEETKQWNDYVLFIRFFYKEPSLESSVPPENLLARCKNSHWIKPSLPLDEPWPLIPIMLLPFFFRAVMWEVRLETEAISYAALDNFAILCHHFFNRRPLWIWWTWSEQCHKVEDFSFRQHHWCPVIPPNSFTLKSSKTK